MEFPEGSQTIEGGKLKIASRFVNFENVINEQLNHLAMSGFADKRLVAVAKTEFEKAFLIIHKAIRIGAPDQYAKQPMPPGGSPFRQRLAGDFDEHGEITSQKHIEWRDAEKDGG